MHGAIPEQGVTTLLTHRSCMIKLQTAKERERERGKISYIRGTMLMSFNESKTKVERAPIYGQTYSEHKCINVCMYVHICICIHVRICICILYLNMYVHRYLFTFPLLI